MNTIPNHRGQPPKANEEPEPPTITPWETLVEAALANLDIQDSMTDPELGRIWRQESIRRSPTCRNEWEYVTVIATVGEAQAAAKHKRFGAFLGIFPLARDDPVHPYQILYCYKSASPYNRRVEQRRELKRILGKKHRPLVTRASRSTKRDFLRTITTDQIHAIRLRLTLDPSRFWRVAKGKEFVLLPKRPRQLTLFDNSDEEAEHVPDAGS
ncbi:MAG: hypothetical protein K8U57_35415 [Planctomycetes bacterium]|nr:hypothetical protein [Planctomycetota bacterium]